jgi:hypothetical protein
MRLTGAGDDIPGTLGHYRGGLGLLGLGGEALAGIAKRQASTSRADWK